MADPDLAAELKKNRRYTLKNAGNISENDLRRRHYEEELHFDVILTAEIDSKRIRAHKDVLREGCKVLRAKLEKLEDTDKILLKNVDGTSLKLIVDSLYFGLIDINIDSVNGVLDAANILKMNEIAQKCYYFIGEVLGSSNCLGIALYAEHHGYTNLHELARTFAIKHFEKVYIEKEFLQLTEPQLKQFLSTDNIAEVSQKILFHSLMKWIGHDAANREQFTYSLLKLVNYKLLDHNFIVTNKKFVLKSNECTELIDSWLRWHPEPSHTLYCMEVNSRQIYNSQMNNWSREEIKWQTSNRVCVKNKSVIIVINGRSVESLDLKTKQLTTLSKMPLEHNLSNPIVFNDNLYVFGGFRNEKFTRSILKFNFTSRTWEEISPLPKSLMCGPLPKLVMYRHSTVKCVTLNGLIYGTNNGRLASYDPVSNEWHQRADMNELKEITNHIAAVRGFLYAVGPTIIERYDPSKDSWSCVKPTTELKSIDHCASLNNRLIIIGQLVQDSQYIPNAIVLEYDPEFNNWNTLAPLKLLRYGEYHVFSV